jgi:hypothetical protein
MQMADNVRDIFSRQRADFDGARRSGAGPVDSGGGPPHDGEMDERVKKLEDWAEKSRGDLHSIDLRLVKIDTRMDAFATRADVSEAKNSIIMWVVGAIFVAQLLPMLKDFVKPSAPVVASTPAPATPSQATAPKPQ